MDELALSIGYFFIYIIFTIGFAAGLFGAIALIYYYAGDHIARGYDYLRDKGWII